MTYHAQGSPEFCDLCGAVGGGNITCPRCRCRVKAILSDSTMNALRGCVVGYPIGTTKESPYVANIKSVNRHNRKARRKGSHKVTI